MINGVPNFFSAFGPNYETQDPSGDSVRVAAPASVLGLNTVEGQQRYSYKIVGGENNNEFTITQTMNGGLDTGEIVVSNAAAIDFEKVQDYTLQIQVTEDNTDADDLGAVQDVQPLSTIASLHIHVNNINEQTHVVAPLVAKDAQGNYIKDANGNPEAPFSIPEGSVDGTVVGAAAVFQYPIDPNTGAPLVVNGKIVTPAVTGTIAVYDGDAEQPNPHAAFRYAITSGNSITINGTKFNGIFAIDPLTGVITVDNTTGLPNSQVLNYLQQQTFNITVQVSDVSVQSTAAITAGSASVEIDLKPVDSTPPTIQPGNATIREYTGASVADPTTGQTVGQVVASAGQTDFSIANYSIVSGDSVTINGSQIAPFAIDPLTGRISINDVTGLDYEIQPVFKLLIKVTDNGSPVPLSSTATFTINLLNENDPITIVNSPSNLNFSVNENTPNNSIVGTIQTHDEDNLNANVQSQFFTISGGNTLGAFSIDAQGHIIVANSAALDFEVHPTFSLIVTVTDTGIPATSDTKTVTINLINVNDPPVVTANQTFIVLEHRLAGTVIGTVLATDEDVPAQTLTFALTGTDGPANAIALDPNTGVLTVTDPHLIDFATTPTIHLTVTATDNGFDGAGNPPFPPATSAPAVVTISLTDDQQPTLPQNQNVSIAENAPNGTVVTTEAVVPGTGTSPFTYSIIGGDANLVNGQTNAFAIDPNTGVITISNPAALDFDTQSSFALRILAVDSAAIKLGDTATVTITLLQAYKAPVLSGIESTTLNYIEKATTAVSSGITIVDPDPVTIASATISISAGYVNGQDTLVFTNTANIKEHGTRPTAR